MHWLSMKKYQAIRRFVIWWNLPCFRPYQGLQQESPIHIWAETISPRHCWLRSYCSILWDNSCHIAEDWRWYSGLSESFPSREDLEWQIACFQEHFWQHCTDSHYNRTEILSEVNRIAFTSERLYYYRHHPNSVMATPESESVILTDFKTETVAISKILTYFDETALAKLYIDRIITEWENRVKDYPHLQEISDKIEVLKFRN